MKLQDYIHYYKGCEVLLPDNSKGELFGISGEKAEVHLEKGYFAARIDHLKPKLRNLGDVTHEEWNELERLTSIRNDMYGCNTFESYFVTNTPTIRPPWILVNEMLTLLRKKHVDVDGLIKNGLAIDSKTLK